MNPGNGLGRLPSGLIQLYNNLLHNIDWDDYNSWLHANKQQLYAHKMFKFSQRYHPLAFTDQLVTMQSSRTKLEILKAIANITRYFDIKNDTLLHEQFTSWLKRKEIQWTVKSTSNNYEIAQILDVDQIVYSLKKLLKRYSTFGLFMLVTGLRTSEAVKAFNEHSKLCNNGIMELFWDRRTKKANAVYCHPILHDQIDCTISRKVYLYINKRKLGFDLRHLRKVNFTINASNVDALLSDYMQGRRGNVSQRHYYLPSMNEHRNKWLDVWTPIINGV